MKSYSAVIPVILSCLFISGCVQDQYSIEKEYYYALKKAEKIFRNPKGSPPNELQKVIALLEVFTQKFPKSKLAVNAEFNIVRLYTSVEEYNDARVKLRKIIDEYGKLSSICSEAVFFLGKTYELENKWDSALAEYKRILNDYPVTARGFNIPVYIIQHYKQKFEPVNMREAVKDAIKHYSSLSEKYPDSILAFRAQKLVAECHLSLEEPLTAIGVFNKMIEKYKDKINTDGLLMSVAIIYNHDLKDKVKTKEILEKLISDYPKSRLVTNAQKILNSL